MGFHAFNSRIELYPVMSKKTEPHPPQWLFKITRFFLKDDFQEEIEGDMEEVFRDNLNRYSVNKSKMLLVLDTFKLIRPSLIKNMGLPRYNFNSMFRNNIKISLRVFNRNRAYTFINILGLSMGLAIAMLILLYVRFELSYENDNPLADRLVRISMDYYNGATMIDQDAEMYSPAGPRITSTFPEVVSFTRVAPSRDVTVKGPDGEFFRETKMFAVDSSFIELFNCRLLYGNSKDIFKAPFEMVLTESQALKYFNRVDVVGESLWVSPFDRDFKITGVMPDSQLNSHFKFNILISFLTVNERAEKFGWNNNSYYTYLLLSDQVSYQGFLDNLNLLNDQLHKENKIPNERIAAQPIKDIHLYSHQSFEMEQNGDAISVFFLLGVAILVIVLAVINYINLATAKALDRAKEVGIRKVVGSSLSQLRVQFFTESFLINLFAASLAIGFILISFPAFKHMAGLPASLEFLNDVRIWYILAVVLLLSTFLSGIFPAIILSSFRPISILKGKFSRSARGTMLRKVLVIFQFAMTLFLLIQTFTAERQLDYMRKINLGVDVEQTIVVRTPNGNESKELFKSFKDQLLANAQVQMVTASSSVPGQPTSEMGSTNVGVNLVGAEETSFNYYITWIDEDFIPAMHVELLEGENFRAQNTSDDNIIVNEEALRLLGIPDVQRAVGRRMTLWGKERTIIGVIKNFHQTSAKEPFIPMLFLRGDERNRFVSVRSQSGNAEEDLSLVKKVYSSVFPDSPFEFFFLDQQFDLQYKSDEQFQRVFGTLSGFAVLIACLGLFGLVSFTVSNRTKEIGVRKVLGASVRQIVMLLSRDFILLILVSTVISIVVTYFLIQTWLQKFAFRVDLTVWLFIIPAGGVLATSVLTIFLKTFQVSSANPVDTLKEE